MAGFIEKVARRGAIGPKELRLGLADRLREGAIKRSHEEAIKPFGLQPAVHRHFPLFGECGLWGTVQGSSGKPKPAPLHPEALTL